MRLRYGYLITCVDVVKDPETGDVVELHCTYDPETRGGNAPDGRKVKATLHWVSARHAFHGEVRLYDRLFLRPDPEGDVRKKDFMAHINPDSLKILDGCKLEPMLGSAAPGEIYQFERMGYFCVDTHGSRPGAPVFNRAVTLRDAWAKIQATQEKKGR